MVRHSCLCCCMCVCACWWHMSLFNNWYVCAIPALNLHHEKTRNLISKYCSGDVIMLGMSAQSEETQTLLHTHKPTHTHRPSCCLRLWSVTGPPLSHWSVGGVRAQGTQLPRPFIALLLPPKEKEAQRTVEPPPPRPSLSPPQTPSCWEEQACGGLEASPLLKAGLWIVGCGHRYPPN